MKLDEYLSAVGGSEDSIISYSGDDAIDRVRKNGYALRYVHEQTREICLEAVVVPGLLQPAVEALGEYSRLLGERQLATLDNIQKSVGTSGLFRASIQSTDQVDDRISSRMQIREAGS